MVLGAREANLGKPDAQLMVSFLRDLGEPAVVKAYADWKRHDDLREGFSAAGFDLVDIPAEGSVGAIAIAVQMTVDAMDVCHKQGGISTFVLLSGDRSFEPLVDRLKSNDRKVVGVAVGATSEPGFLENFDPFVSYESILEAAEAAEAAAEAERESDGAVTSEPLDEAAASASLDEATASVSLDEATASVSLDEATASESLDEATASESLDASLPDASEVKTAQEGASDDLAERDVFELMLEVISEMEHRPRALLWGSKVKQAMKSKDPSFSENRYGFETFAELLEEAERRKVITLKREERSGTYIVTGFVRV